MANTLFLGKVYHHFDELPSTNDYARELLAKSKPPEGTVIRAASQSAGHGQYGSKWETDADKNLTLSIILYPNWLPITGQFRLSEIVALALRETIVSACAPQIEPIHIKIKWPNDIYIYNQKTAGVLIQNTLKGSMLEASIIGIGLNVNQLAFPKTLPNATSLGLITKTVFDLDKLADQVLEYLERYYLQLKSGKTDTLRAAYHEQLLGIGAMRSFARPSGAHFQGIIQGVAMDGRLIVQHENGLENFAVKTLQML